VEDERMPVLGRKQIDAEIQARVSRSGYAPDRVMAAITCPHHMGEATATIYEDGVLFVRCARCHFLIVLIEVAENGRGLDALLDPRGVFH